MNETEIVIRKNIHDVYAIKLKLLSLYEVLDKTNIEIRDYFEQINNHDFHRLEYQTQACGENRIEQEIDKRCWFYLVKIYHLQKYMLCTEYEKLTKQLQNFDFPVFNLDNAEAWLSSLKELVYENVQTLIKDVYKRITEQTYYTGSGYSNKVKKKRNNNGIDARFILTTYDHNHIAWWSGKPTITDDLEKACYIIDGKMLPEQTIKENLRKEKRLEGENAYFKILICKNGNTHYHINEEIRKKLNFFGAERGVISDGIKIKIFDKD